MTTINTFRPHLIEIRNNLEHAVQQGETDYRNAENPRARGKIAASLAEMRDIRRRLDRLLATEEA